MNKSKIKVYYIYHSGFAVETENHFLVFDYYMIPEKDANSSNSLKSSLEELIKNRENVLVFSSHSHGDHFNAEILKWKEINSNIKYIFSSDIVVENLENNYYKLSQYEELILQDEKLSSSKNNSQIPLANVNNNSETTYIKTFGSTDIGISFLVKVDGITLFHAGDLNWWHWKDDPIEEQQLMEKNFKSEVKKIKGKKIDVAFFPVDPRLEEYYSIGAEYFIKEVSPSLLIPMHFGNNTYITKDFAKKIKDYPVKAVIINDVMENLSI